MTKESDFGKGFAYCLGLFLAHQYWGQGRNNSIITDSSLWFSAAKDHLYEMEIPKNFSEYDACVAWREECFSLADIMCDRCKIDDVKWALDKAKYFLLQWDKQCEIDAVEANYQ